MAETTKEGHAAVFGEQAYKTTDSSGHTGHGVDRESSREDYRNNGGTEKSTDVYKK